MSARQRLTFAAMAVVVAVLAVVGISASGGGSDDGDTTSAPQEAVAGKTTPEPTATQEGQATEAPPEERIPKVVVKDGEPVGGVEELEVREGDRVRFTVVSDVADEVHVHGYDLMKDVSAGGQATFSFKATITGIFEAELEGRGEQIVSLRVDPK